MQSRVAVAVGFIDLRTIQQDFSKVGNGIATALMNSYMTA